jgi:hypothetical protein
MSALTGFAQMPIFKRYYIADLPGLGWLAQFYTTYWLHYVSAIAFLAIAAYLMTDYFLLKRKSRRITFFGYVRGIMLLIILATGALLVYRNLPGIPLPPESGDRCPEFFTSGFGGTFSDDILDGEANETILDS